MQPLNRAYIPTRSYLRQPSLETQFYAYPPNGESTIYLMTGPIIVVNERPVEQDEGTVKKCLSLAVAALNFITTVIGACVQ
jgi:hypothetical protein